MSDTFTHPTEYPVLPRQYRIIERGGRTVAAVMMPYPVRQPEDAKCLNDEAFGESLTRVPRTQIAYMKAKCASCPLVTACAEWGIAHEREYLFGGLTPDERKAIRRDRGQVVVDPHAAHEYGMGDEYIQNRNRAWLGEGNPNYKDGRYAKGPDINSDAYAHEQGWVHPLD